MVETYKITTGQYDIVVAPTLVEAEICVTRGYDYRLQLQVINYQHFRYVNKLQGTTNSHNAVCAAQLTV